MIPPDTISLATAFHVDRDRDLERIVEYTRERLRQELNGAPHGAIAALGRKLNVSGPHISNIIAKNPTRSPGDNLRRSLAAHWGITVHELEMLALGRDPEAYKSGEAEAFRALAIADKIDPEVVQNVLDMKYADRGTTKTWSDLMQMAKALMSIRQGRAAIESVPDEDLGDEPRVTRKKK